MADGNVFGQQMQRHAALSAALVNVAGIGVRPAGGAPAVVTTEMGRAFWQHTQIVPVEESQLGQVIVVPGDQLNPVSWESFAMSLTFGFFGLRPAEHGVLYASYLGSITANTALPGPLACMDPPGAIVTATPPTHVVLVSSSIIAVLPHIRAQIDLSFPPAVVAPAYDAQMAAALAAGVAAGNHRSNRTGIIFSGARISSARAR